jgi:hypothetical protein
MTISKTAVTVTFSPLVSTTVFDFGSVIDFADDSEIEVYKDLVLLVEGPDYTLVGTIVTTVVGVVLGEDLIITRVTPLTQTKDLMDSDPIPVEVLEEGLDRLERQIQEVNSKVTTPVAELYPLPTPDANKLIGWDATATALENKTNDLDAIWVRLAAVEARLNDEVDPQLLDHESRIALIEGTSLPAITAEFVLKDITLSNHEGRLVDHEDRITDLEAAELDHELRLGELELAKFYSTDYVIGNNRLALTPLGFALDGNVHTSAFIVYEINRNTDINYRTSSGTIHMVYRASSHTWATERGLTTIDMDDLTFSVVDDGGGNAHIVYTSNNLAGTSYVGNCKFKALLFNV